MIEVWIQELLELHCDFNHRVLLIAKDSLYVALVQCVENRSNKAGLSYEMRLRSLTRCRSLDLNGCA